MLTLATLVKLKRQGINALISATNSKGNLGLHKELFDFKFELDKI
jgi:hypothetical protein